MKNLKRLLPVFILLLYALTISAQAPYIPSENFGGKTAFKELLKSEMVYPETSLKNDEEGTVTLNFTITETGETKDLEIVQKATKALNDEAIRLFNHLLWSPAINKGTAMEVKQQLDFKFKIKKYEKLVKHRGYDQIKYPYEPVDFSMKVYAHKKLDTLPKPVYTRNDMNFTDFMIENLKYPDAAKKQGVQGTVELFFVVEPSGNISNFKVEKSVGAGCSEEALRLLKLLSWFPGIKNGKAVRTAMSLNITFNLDDSDNMRYVPANNANQI